MDEVSDSKMTTEVTASNFECDRYTIECNSHANESRIQWDLEHYTDNSRKK